MKRVLSLLLILVLALSLSAPAFADVLWEPENRFYEKHADECQVLQRSFYVNGESGYVNLFAAPDSSTVNLQLQNGEKVYVYWQYLDWGYVEVNNDGGWLPLSELELIYDYLSFESEFGNQFAPYDPAACQPLLDAWEGSTLTLWPYPGAEQAKYVWQNASDAMEQLKTEGDSYFRHTFTDEEGLTWAFCSYLWGNRNFWVCLDAPAGRDDSAVVSGDVELPVREVEEPELIPAQEPQMPASYLLPAVLVAAAIVLTIAALLLLRKKKAKA